METEGHRRRTRGERGRGESMVQEGQGTGSASVETSASSRKAATAESGANGAVADLVGSGCGLLRVSRRGLDHGAGGGDDQARVRGQLSSGPWLSPPSPPQTESAKTHPS